ncbi:MAG: metallophosphoesterase family protein [Desulfobacter sp.]|nr:MAG: metallophosphoesterase family protein [Desulfobacter sp.]
MRIYAVADIHGKKRHLAAIYGVLDKYAPDIIVAAGDLTSHLKYRTCLSQLDCLPVPVLAVRGNTDLKRIESRIGKARNLHLLTPAPYHAGGLSFSGVSGTLVLPLASRICLGENKLLTTLPCPMDEDSVLVAHPPPKGICDRVAGKFSVGSKNLAGFIRTAQPALALCGHIHEQPGKGRIGRTIVVNCAMGRSGIGALIDMEKGRSPHVNFLHRGDL